MNNYSQGGARVGVIGAAGYAGLELIRLLLRHPAVTLAAAMSSGRTGGEVKPLAERVPALAGLTDLDCTPASLEAVRAARLDLVFLATPHDVSLEWVPRLWNETEARIVDLSGAFRLCDAAEFERWYRMPHSAPELLDQAVYGWPERYAGEIAGARLVANPGCYALAAITALWPLVAGGVASGAGVICDAKSGASGAGKGLREDLHFVELEGNCKAYGLATHRHTPEIAARAGLAPEQFTFTPHLLPVSRGILATNYVPLRNGATAADLAALYRRAYAGARFVRIREERLPELRDVAHTNFCDLGFHVRSEARQAIVVSCLDNLLKGASGQAVQNMNCMLGLPEEAGLL